MLATLDHQLLDGAARPGLRGLMRFLTEFWYFGLKEARACLFVALFFGAVFVVPRTGLFGLPRYDVLLPAALAIQGWMVWARLETWDELESGQPVSRGRLCAGSVQDLGRGACGATPTRSVPGRRCTSASGVPGRCWSS